jgi:hypothetical protein
MVNYQLVALAVGAVAGTGGAILLWSGLRNYRQGTAIGGASSLGEQLGTGSLATVEGTIADAIGGETLDSALGGAPCVAYSSRKVTRRARDQRDIPRAGVNGADVREWFGPVHDGRQDWDCTCRGLRCPRGGRERGLRTRQHRSGGREQGAALWRVTLSRHGAHRYGREARTGVSRGLFPPR